MATSMSSTSAASSNKPTTPKLLMLNWKQLYRVKNVQKLPLKQLETIANNIREDIIRMLEHAGSGHSAGPLGLADIFAALYFDILKHDPKKPDWDERVILIKRNS